MTRFEVDVLPKAACAWVGSSRSKREYNEAKEELRAAVATVMPAIPASVTRPHLTIVAFVGDKGDGDGYFRAQCPRTLTPALDGVYEALVDAGWVESMAAVPVITVAVFTGCEKEGLQITISEIEEAA